MQRLKLSIISILSVVCLVLIYNLYIEYQNLMDRYTTQLEQHTHNTNQTIVKYYVDIVTSSQPPLKATRQSQKVPVDKFDNPSWSKTYKVSPSVMEDREIRYGVTSRRIKIDNGYMMWQGGRSLPVEELTKLAKYTLLKMPHISSNTNVVSLIVETAIAESDGGRLIDTGSGDFGVMQIRVSTANDLLNWLSITHKDIRESIMSLYNNKLSIADNLKHNIPFSMAMAITEYWRKAGPLYHQHIATVTERGIMWTSVYNTSKGKGTVNKYIERVTTTVASSK